MYIYKILRSCKKYLLASTFIRRLDFLFRKFFSYIFLFNISSQRLLYKLSSHPKKINNAHILFIGGIGDFISMSKIIDFLESKDINVVAYVPNASFFFAKSLFPNIDVISYNYKNFIAVGREIMPTENCCFIYTNPTIESHVFKFVSGIQHSAGFAIDYLRLDSTLVSTTFRKNDGGLYARANDLQHHLNEIFLHSSPINKFTKKINKIYPITKKDVILVNFFKSTLWSGAGNISENIQTYLLDNISVHFPNHEIYYVGTDDLSQKVEQIIAKCKIHTRIHNLCGRTSPQELIELVGRAQFVLTIDGGLLHLASHLNTNCYALTNFSDSTFFSPVNIHSIQSMTNCSPCLKPKGDPIDNYPVICHFGYRCSHDYEQSSLDRFIFQIRMREQAYLES